MAGAGEELPTSAAAAIMSDEENAALSHLQPPVRCPLPGDYLSHAAHANDFHKFFELDSVRNFLHTRITSQPALFASPAKLLFACQPCCGAYSF